MYIYMYGSCGYNEQRRNLMHMYYDERMYVIKTLCSNDGKQRIHK